MANTTWVLDPTHSELGFKIRHLMISNVSGFFTDFEVRADINEESLETAFVQAKIRIASINTNNIQRDEHLRNSDFFEVGQYPEALFESTKVQKIDDENYRVVGYLDLKGVRKPLELQVLYSGIAKDPWGAERAGFTINAKINRSDWGISFNSVLDTGKLALGEEVKINGELQLVKQAVTIAA
jgi:polyisoprenoid-binding protein YceI